METQAPTKTENLINLNFVLSIIGLVSNLGFLVITVTKIAVVLPWFKFILVPIFYIGLFSSLSAIILGIFTLIRAIVRAILNNEKLAHNIWKLAFSLFAIFSFAVSVLLSAKK